MPRRCSGIFTCCTVIGIRTVDREARLQLLLDEFVTVLRSEGVAAEHCEPDRCRLEVDLLALVLFCIASVVVSKGYWDNQGNTLDDYRAWSSRILSAVRAVDADRASRALGVSPELVRRPAARGRVEESLSVDLEELDQGRLCRPGGWGRLRPHRERGPVVIS
jgi:hypothetical protein